MSRRRRALLLVGLALVLGGLAASDVVRREAALARQLAPLVTVVVARSDLEAGTRLRPAQLGVRTLPARFAPVGAAGTAAELVGRRLAVPVLAGGYVAAGALETGATDRAAVPVRRGERVAEVVATGSAELIVPGARVDVLVTREGERDAPGGTELALEDVEVLAAAPAPGGTGADAREATGSRLAASLRVSVRQAVYLAAAQAFARDVRLLPRAAGDRRRAGALAVTEALR